MAYQVTQKIPKGWTMTTLGEMAKVQTGPFGSQLHNEDYVDVGTPIITVENLVNNCIMHTQNTPKVSDEDKARLIKYSLRKGDVVFSRVGSVDRCAYVSDKEDGWLFSGRLLRVRPKEELSDRYVFYWITQENIKAFVRKIAVGATMPSINTELLSQVPICFPPLPEQRAIADVLSSLDDKIELLRKNNKALENIAQTLFKRWFVEYEFPNEKGKPYKSSGGKMIDSELGKIPAGWRVGRLEDEFKVIMGQSPDGDSYNERGKGMIFFQGRTDFQERFPRTRLYTTEPKRIAEKNDVLVSVRAPVGDINVAFEKCCVGRGLGAVRGKLKSYTLYKIQSLKDVFKSFEAEGTVFGSINKDSFAGIEVIIPTEHCIEKYEGIVRQIDQKIYNNTTQIQTASRLRDSLLPRLMKGELRVKGYNN